MKLGMLIPEFPTQTHVFFWREIRALERLDVSVDILSTREPRESCPHPFAAEARARTHYLVPPGPRALGELSARLRHLPGALRYLASIDRDPGPESLKQRLQLRARHAAYLAAALELVAYAKRHGTEHVHVHSCADAAHVVALSKLLGGPSFSLHLHGDLPVYGRDHAQKMQHAAFVAAAARPMQMQVVNEVGVPESRTCTMIMGVDTDQFTPGPSRAGERGRFEMLTVGRLSPAKGHVHTLRALRLLLDRDPNLNLRYRIAGQGAHRDAIVAEIAALGLGDKVELVGSMAEPAIAEALRGVDVFVLSSIGIGEASPVAVMEAMSAGVPVVCSRIGGTADMIDDGVDGLLIDQKDEEGIAAALRRLYDDRSLGARLGSAARQRALTQFDAVRRAEILLETVRATRAGGSVPNTLGRPVAASNGAARLQASDPSAS
jgi:glycosyltransferase involved in cell wall biosynthesis